MSRPMVSMLAWLNDTFSSRERTEDLLRPDLEDGTITPRDYRAAAAFYPSNTRYLPYAFSSLGAISVFVYGRFLKRPPMSLARISSLGVLSGIIGQFYGQYRIVSMHKDFVRHLENRPGFYRALENVNIRTGGRQPLGLLRPPSQQAGAAAPHSEQREQDADPWSDPPPDDDPTRPQPAAQPPSAPRGPQPQPEPSRQGRWGEIRAANTRNAGPRSAWDEVRQSHERTRIASASQSPNDEPPRDALSSPDRDSEQAKFDAMLEAERRKADASTSASSSGPWRG